VGEDGEIEEGATNELAISIAATPIAAIATTDRKKADAWPQ
jgi:hypothetical protein